MLVVQTMLWHIYHHSLREQLLVLQNKCSDIIKYIFTAANALTTIIRTHYEYLPLQTHAYTRAAFMQEDLFNMIIDNFALA